MLGAVLPNATPPLYLSLAGKVLVLSRRKTKYSIGKQQSVVLTVGAVAGLPLDTGAGVWPNGRLCGGLSGSMKTIFLTKEGGGRLFLAA